VRVIVCVLFFIVHVAFVRIKLMMMILPCSREAAFIHLPGGHSQSHGGLQIAAAAAW